MGRSRGGGGRAPARAPARRAPHSQAPARPASTQAKPPAPVQPPQPPAVQQQGGGRMSGLMGTVAEGFAFGTGSAIARRAVGAASDAIFGSGSGSDSAPVEQYEQVCGGMMSGLMGTMAQGLAFGTGSAVAHRAVGAASNAIFGGSDSAPVEQYEQAPQQQNAQAVPTACSMDQQNFFACLQQNQGNVQSCQVLYDALQMCQQSQGGFQQQY